MTREAARREIESLDYYLQNHTDDYGEESHTAMMMAISALSEKDWKFYYDHGYAQAKRDLSENKEDLISRQAVIKLIDHLDVDFANSFDPHTLTEMYRCVKELPSIENEGEWIPVSERLPQKGEYGKVLVTYIPSGGTLWTTVMIAHYSDLMGIAKPSFHIGEVGKESFQNITKQVIAWMPLPEPYKENET